MMIMMIVTVTINILNRCRRRAPDRSDRMIWLEGPQKRRTDGPEGERDDSREIREAREREGTRNTRARK